MKKDLKSYVVLKLIYIIGCIIYIIFAGVNIAEDVKELTVTFSEQTGITVEDIDSEIFIDQEDTYE